MSEKKTFAVVYGLDNYGRVLKLQEKTAYENGEVTTDKGFDGISKVIVDVAGAAEYKRAETISV